MEIVKKIKKVGVTVKEIHNSFFNRKIISETLTIEVSSNLQSKADRLKKFGFTSSIPCVKLKKIEEKNEKIEEKNEPIRVINTAFDYFSYKYPLYKFITEDDIMILCRKYNLVFADICKYIGDVPDSKLKEIENVKIDANDIKYSVEVYFTYKADGGSFNHSREKRGTFNELLGYRKGGKIEAYGEKHKITEVDDIKKHDELMIVAPKSLIRLNEYEKIKKNKIINKDPIVFHPVMFKGKEYFLIMAAWGDEASDEKVVNEKYN